MTQTVVDLLYSIYVKGINQQDIIALNKQDLTLLKTYIYLFLSHSLHVHNTEITATGKNVNIFH